MAYSRAALRELSARSTVSMGAARPFSSIVGTPTGMNLPESYLTPSPDEQVIRQRGLRRPMADVNPRDLADDLRLLLATPITPPKRTSPRKRRPETPTSPSKSPNKSSVQIQLVKRHRFLRQEQTASPADAETVLQGLSYAQLLDVITRLLNVHPELRQEVVDTMPLPDLRPLEEKLSTIRGYIQRSVGNSQQRTRLSSPRDAFNYRRVSEHLVAFKKQCVDQGRVLLDSQHWSSVIDYCMLAWEHVTKLPDWENPSHNRIKEQCFQALANLCMQALKRGNFEQQHLGDIHDRLKEAYTASVEIGPCLQYIARTLQKI